MMKCPYCDNGVSRYSNYGFRWSCTICDGTGVLPDEKQNEKKEQNEKEKTEKENKKTEEKGELVS